MSQENETVGHNLVKNGSFADRTDFGEGKAWQNRGAATSHQFETDADGTTFLRLKTNAVVTQDILLPKAASGQATERPCYRLQFRYQLVSFAESRVALFSLATDGGETLIDERTLQGALDSEPEDNDAKPGAITWHKHVWDLPLGGEVTAVRLKFITPENTGGNRSLVLTGVAQYLELPPLAVSTMTLTIEKEPDNIVQHQLPFKLCHGATHCLTVTTQAGNAWMALPLSLEWGAENAGQPLLYGLQATPPFNVPEQEQEAAWQDLVTEEVSWKIVAEGWQEHNTQGGFTVDIVSYYTAERYRLTAALGDPLYRITSQIWDEVVPIVDQEDSTLVRVRVTSEFEPERGLEGKTVQWKLDGEEIAHSKTKEQGWAEYRFTPTAENVGDCTLTAHIQDEFSQSSDATFTIPVFQSSPWAEQLDILLDDQPIGGLDQPPLLLWRGQSHRLTLKPKTTGSYFIDKALILRWPSDQGETPEQLGITFLPDLGTPQTMNPEGISWQVEAGNSHSGRFTLQVTVAGLPTPLSLSGRQLSAELSDELELEVVREQAAGPVILWRGEALAIKVSPKNGSVIHDLPCRLSWASGEGLTAQDVPCLPGYDRDQLMVAEGVGWQLTGSASKSGVFSVQVSMAGFTTVLSISDNRLLSPQLSDELALQFSQQAPVIFWRGQPQNLSVQPVNPAAMVGLMTYLAWGEEGNLFPDAVSCEPTYDREQAIGRDGAHWVLTGSESQSGTFSLQVGVTGFETHLQVSGNRLLSRDLSDEVALQLDDVPLPLPLPPLVFHRGVPGRLQLRSKNGLALVGLSCSLVWVSGHALEEGDVRCQPDYGEEFSLDPEENTWNITGSDNKSGMFTVSLCISGFENRVTLSNIKLLSDQLADELPYWLTNEGEEKKFDQLVCIGSRPTRFLLSGGSYLTGIPFVISSSAEESSLSPAVNEPFTFTNGSAEIRLTPKADKQGYLVIKGEGFTGEQKVIWSSSEWCSEG